MTLPKFDDDLAALGAFTKSVPRETMADRRERSEAGAKRVKQAFWQIQSYSLCAGLGCSAAALIVRPLPLLPKALILPGAIIGAVVGSILFVLFVLISHLRHGGWRSEERVNLVPTIWFYGPLGAIGGSTFVALTLLNAFENAAVAVPILVGGIVGFLGCAVIRFLRNRRNGVAADVRYFWP
jgi:hypothetical protein